MNTTNLISTPNIEGNVSSCQTNVQSFQSSRISAWKIENTTIATNNCTGTVEHYTTWSYSPFGLVILTVAIICALCVFFAIKPTCACQYRGGMF